MSDDWNIGDLVVCVDDGPQFPNQGPSLYSQLKVGRAYRVSAIGVTREIGAPAVDVVGIPRSPQRPLNPNFSAERFRKVRPDAREACETEFVTLLKRSKRKVSA